MDSDKGMTLEHCCTVGEPRFSPYGHVIALDGTTYNLNRQWYHGVVLALLFPDKAKEAGKTRGREYWPVPDEPNVFHYQGFELDHHDVFPVIRTCFGRMMSPPSVNMGKEACTKAQVEALQKVFKLHGLKGRDTVSTDWGDKTVAQVLGYAADAGSRPW